MTNVSQAGIILLEILILWELFFSDFIFLSGKFIPNFKKAGHSVVVITFTLPNGLIFLK